MRSLVVEWRLPPVANYQLGNEHGDLTVRVRAFHLQDVIDQGHEDEAVRGADQDKLRRGKTRGQHRSHHIPFEHRANLSRAVLGIDVDRLDVAADLEGKAQSFFSNAGPSVEWDDDQRLSKVGKVDGSFDVDGPSDTIVVAFDPGHNNDEQRNQDNGDPGSVAKLGDQDDQKSNPGGECPNAVNDHAVEASRRIRAFPMDDHARLGEGDGEKCTDRKERNEAISDSPESCQQQRGEADKGIDAMGVEEPAAANLEDVRKVVALSNGTG